MHLHIKYTWLFSCSVMPNFLPSHGLQHSRLPCPSPSPRVCSNSGPLSRWYYLTISSSATLFKFWLQSFPESRSFPMSMLFTSGGQSKSFSSSISTSGFISFRIDRFDVLCIQGTPKSLLQHHCLKASVFGTQPSLWSNSHIRTWLLEKPQLKTVQTLTPLGTPTFP